MGIRPLHSGRSIERFTAMAFRVDGAVVKDPVGIALAQGSAQTDENLVA